MEILAIFEHLLIEINGLYHQLSTYVKNIIKSSFFDDFKFPLAREQRAREEC